MAKQQNTDDEATPGRIKQMRMVAGLVHKANPRALPIVIGSGLGVLVVLVVVGLLIGQAGFLIPLGVLGGILVSLFLFGRFAQTAQYSTIEGQPGAAAAVLQSMRGNWTVTPAIAANRNMDVVHRAVGRPGVVLVGEGSPNRLPSLLAAEKKRVGRVAFDVPMFDFQVGDGKGQVPLRQLQKKDHEAAARPQGYPGRRPELPAQGAAAVAAGPQGPGAARRPPAQDAEAAGAAEGGLHPDDDRVGRLVVQAAPVAVDDQRRHHGQQQQRADEAPADANRLAVQPGDPQAE